MDLLNVPERSPAAEPNSPKENLLNVPERSPAADEESESRATNMLTFLYAHFPHRWLSSNAEGAKRLFKGLCSCFLYASELVDVIVRNSRTRTALELLQEIEDEYGLPVNPSADISVRRVRIIAQKRALDWPVTERQLLEIFKMLGVEAYIHNYHNEHRLEFNITENALNIPNSDIYRLLNDNVRAHVEISVIVRLCITTTQYCGGNLTLTTCFNFCDPEPPFINIASEQHQALTLGMSACFNFYDPEPTVINIVSEQRQALTVGLSASLNFFGPGL